MTLDTFSSSFDVFMCSTSGQLRTSPRLQQRRRSYLSSITCGVPQSPTSTESQSQSLPTERRHDRTKVAFHHPEPLSRGISADSRTDRDVVTDTASSALNQDRGSGKTDSATRGQRGTSTATENILNDMSRSPRTRPSTRRHHGGKVPNLDIIATRQEPRIESSTASTLAATAERPSLNRNRGFRARLMLSQARKTIENHKPDWSASGTKRIRQRRPFIMDVVLELKAQYAGYTTEDVYVTFEAMRRNEDSRPVFEYLAHDFSAGAESVDAYWNDQAKFWHEWKTPDDDRIGCVGGSTFPVGSSCDPEADKSSMGTPPSSLLSVGRAHFPDSSERSTASWCPVLNCDYVARSSRSSAGPS